MTAMYNAHKVFRASARVLGLNRVPLLRRMTDAAKRTLHRIHPPFALPVQGFWLQGFPLAYYLAGSYEQSTTDYFNKTIQPGWTAVDVGADFGYFSLLFSRLVGKNGRVFAFEPFAASCKTYLEPNIARNAYTKNITLANCGLSDQSTTKNYFEGTHGFYAPEKNVEPTEKVHVVSFDDFFTPYGGRVDIVKIDVEGGEPAVLRGMRRTIQDNPAIKIVFEIAPHILERVGSSAEELLDVCEGFGMRFFWIEENGDTTLVTRAELMQRLSEVKYTNVLCQR